jgi:hypothetical protein
VTTSPFESTAAQNDDEGQEILEKVPMESTCASFQVDEPPPGLLEVTTSPFESTAAQNEDEGQEISERVPTESTNVWFQADAPPPGLLEVTTSPFESTAAQNEDEGQEILESADPIATGTDHVNTEAEASALVRPFDTTGPSVKSALATQMRSLFRKCTDVALLMDEAQRVVSHSLH